MSYLCFAPFQIKAGSKYNILIIIFLKWKDTVFVHVITLVYLCCGAASSCADLGN